MSLLQTENPPPIWATGSATPVRVTAEFMSDIIRATCRRFPSTGQTAETAHIERLIQS